METDTKHAARCELAHSEQLGAETWKEHPVAKLPTSTQPPTRYRYRKSKTAEPDKQDE